jgi:hypothetical protein
MNLQELLQKSLSVPNKRTLVVFKCYQQAKLFNSTFILSTDVPCKLRDLSYTSKNGSIVILGFAKSREDAFQKYCCLILHCVVIVDNDDLLMRYYLSTRLRGSDDSDYSLYVCTENSLNKVELRS